jgi:hypothetical protein
MPDGSSRSYPLCAVELKDAMSGAKDSKTCYRRTQVPTNLNPDTYCDPLGDDNVVATTTIRHGLVVFVITLKIISTISHM